MCRRDDKRQLRWKGRELCIDFLGLQREDERGVVEGEGAAVEDKNKDEEEHQKQRTPSSIQHLAPSI